MPTITRLQAEADILLTCGPPLIHVGLGTTVNEDGTRPDLDPFLRAGFEAVEVDPEWSPTDDDFVAITTGRDLRKLLMAAKIEALRTVLTRWDECNESENGVSQQWGSLRDGIQRTYEALVAEGKAKYGIGVTTEGAATLTPGTIRRGPRRRCEWG